MIAFEPNAKEFGLLTANVLMSGTQMRTTLLQKAVRARARADAAMPSCCCRCTPLVPAWASQRGTGTRAYDCNQP